MYISIVNGDFMKLIIYGLIITFSFIGIFIDEAILGKFISNDQYFTNVVALFLLVLIMIVLKERFLNNLPFSLITYIVISVIVYYNYYLYGLIAIIYFDLFYKKKYFLGIIISIIPIYLLLTYHTYYLVFIITFTSIIGYILNKQDSENKYYTKTLDNERRLRYDLENAKIQLLNNSREIERITEIKERNRIARDIHDNVGHDIAGVLFQLQAAKKIYTKDEDKSLKIISICIEKLSDTLEMIRNTVYNIKPNQELSEKIFYDIIDKFVFCKVDFKFSGNITIIKPETLEILIVNLKESLTNASKYSGATKIDISIEVNNNFVRYLYNDNGNGCNNINEGLGISGMKERVKNVGGMINFDGIDGFSIICIIPNQKTNIFSE